MSVDLLSVGQLACAHGFFGNVYEAIVRVPHRVSADYASLDGDQRLRSPLGPGSPVRYYLPGVPVGIGATIGALLTRRSDPRDRRWLSAGAAALAVSSVLTGYLVRNVNITLFVAGHPMTANQRAELLRTWYRLNMIRIIASGSAWMAFERVRRASPASD